MWAAEVEALGLVRKGGVAAFFLSALWASGVPLSLLLWIVGGAVGAAGAAALLAASAATAYLFGYRWLYRGARALEGAWPEAGVIRLGALMYLLSPLVVTALAGYLLVFVVGSRRLHRRYGVEDLRTASVLFSVALAVDVAALAVVVLSLAAMPELAVYMSVVQLAVGLLTLAAALAALAMWYAGLGVAAARLRHEGSQPAQPASAQPAYPPSARPEGSRGGGGVECRAPGGPPCRVGLGCEMLEGLRYMLVRVGLRGLFSVACGG